MWCETTESEQSFPPRAHTPLSWVQLKNGLWLKGPGDLRLCISDKPQGLPKLLMGRRPEATFPPRAGWEMRTTGEDLASEDTIVLAQRSVEGRLGQGDSTVLGKPHSKQKAECEPDGPKVHVRDRHWQAFGEGFSPFCRQRN